MRSLDPTLLRASAVAIAAIAAIAATGCDCAGNLRSDGPCDGSGALPGCHQRCDATTPCRSGLYCSVEGTCTADCVAGEACGGDGTCTGDGRCVHIAMDGGGARDAAPVDAQAADNTCASVTIDATRTTPNVLLVIDRSGSMDTGFEGGRSRWQVLESALLDTPDGLVFSLQSSVRFGFAMYSEVRGGGCPDLITVPTALDNHTAIDTEYRMHDPSGGTPTGDSIQAILGMLDTLITAPDQPTIFVLATDGEPDTCEDGDDEVNGRRESLEAVQAAFGAGIRTFVISVGTGVSAAHLQAVANAGVGVMSGDPDAPFWVATDTAGLVSALETIVGGVVSCQVELEGTIDPARACDGEVRIGGDLLTCDTDWRAIDATHIELLGAACDRLQTTSDELTATFPCGVIII